MTSLSFPARPAATGHLRPLNILRDLPRVADLIELCFASNMDSEGQSYIQQMRRASRDASFMRWASNTVEGASMPLSGFVWEQDGRIVGNASLVPFRHNGRRIYLIANIATHPDYRRQGIARALTEQAMQHARQRGATALWLHVRADNPEAIKIYTDLGFVERARRTSWSAPTNPHVSPTLGLPPITRRLSRFWPQQQAWLNQLHPEELAWYRAWNWNGLKPGLWNWLFRFFIEFDIRQWAALKNGLLQAVLIWMPTPRNDPLWLACGPEPNPEAVLSLLLHARRELSFRRSLVLEHPAGAHAEAIQAAGFSAQRTLIWMKAPGLNALSSATR